MSGTGNNNIGTIMIPLSVKIEGYQQQINALKDALSRVGKNTDLGKSLRQTIILAEREVDKLAARMSQSFGTSKQVGSFFSSFDGLDERFAQAGAALSALDFRDIDTSYATQQLKSLTDALNTLEQELADNYTKSFQNLLAGSTQISDALKNLSIDPKSLSIDNWKSVFNSAFHDATQNAEQLKNVLDGIDARLLAIGAESGATIAGTTENNAIISALSDPQKFITDVLGGLSTYAVSNSADPLKNAIIASLKTLKGDDQLKAEAENAIISAFSSTDPKDIATELSRIYSDSTSSLRKLFGSGINSQQGAFNNEVVRQLQGTPYESLGSGSIRTVLTDIDSLTKAMSGIDVSGVTKVTTALEQYMLAHNNFGMDAKDASKFIKDVEKDLNANKVAEGYQKITDAIVTYRKELEQLLSARGTASTQLNDVTKEISDITQAGNLIKAGEAQIRAAQAPLQDQAEQVRGRRRQRQQEMIDRERKTGGEVQSRARAGQEENNKLLQHYNDLLDRAKEKQQLIGKLEGVAQSWFSIYAVVNMVRNAIRSVTETVKELDKTITEIAIVTNMTQEDLWKQMSSYTDMARQYGTSISGVYQVSQLFYQQGLQTADVMKLTEETLKMARISGLDYATATDYMTNALRSFKMEMSDASRIVDVYSAIAAKSATDTAELATAMSKTASSAESVGSSFENTTAMMAVMIGNSVPYAA